MAQIKYKIITCDECSHQFKFKPKVLKTKKLDYQGIGITKSYFICPKCKHEYVVMYQDQEYMDNLKEMEIIRQKASQLRFNDDRYLRLLDQHNWFHSRNLGISKKYKQIFGS